MSQAALENLSTDVDLIVLWKRSKLGIWDLDGVETKLTGLVLLTFANTLRRTWNVQRMSAYQIGLGDLDGCQANRTLGLQLHPCSNTLRRAWKFGLVLGTARGQRISGTSTSSLLESLIRAGNLAWGHQRSTDLLAARLSMGQNTKYSQNVETKFLGFSGML